ncbi:MAG: prefoldin subunit alpha [Thermoprotei archaeon]|nr:prefoldin subunit alpha [Thermoproteales archaeon]RLE87075.1 MAG: prefoldin subunit alpha [Thermoprotei archaeon]RLE96801.1 MAG: prefoldin subunit alpha [Thermoprotei archaeon]
MSEERSRRERLAAEYTALSQLVEEVRRRIELLNATLNEVASAKSALEELEIVEEGEELLVPIGAGVYVRTRISGKSEVLVTIGANILVEKSIEEARKYLDEREQKLRDLLQRHMSDYQSLVSRLGEIERELRSRSGG